MENIVNIQDHQEPGYPALAAEKIAAELKSFTGGSKEKAFLRGVPAVRPGGLQDPAHAL